MSRFRVSFDTTKETKHILDQFPHGFRRPLFDRIAEQLVDGYINNGGTKFLGKIISGHVTLQEINKDG